MSLEFSPNLFEVIQEALPDETKEAKENKNDILRKERERQKKGAWLAKREWDRAEKAKREAQEAEERAVKRVLRLAGHCSFDSRLILAIAHGIALSPITPHAMAERYQDAIQWCQPIPFEERREYMETLMSYCKSTMNMEVMMAFYDIHMGNPPSTSLRS